MDANTGLRWGVVLGIMLGAFGVTDAQAGRRRSRPADADTLEVESPLEEPQSRKKRRRATDREQSGDVWSGDVSSDDSTDGSGASADAPHRGRRSSGGKGGGTEDEPFDAEVPGEHPADRFWESPPPASAPPPQGVRAPAGRPSRAVSPIKISGVLFDGLAPGDPDPEEAVRLTNVDSRHSVDLGGFSLSDVFGPPRLTGPGAGIDTAVPRSAVLPPGTRLPPGGELWVAWDGAAFTRTFGFSPAFEGRDTRDDVPAAELRGGWPQWSALHGVVSLHDREGQVVDVVPYERGDQGDLLDKASLPRNMWSGPSVMLFHSSPYGWKGQVLARDRNSLGLLLPDTDSAADWDAGFSTAQPPNPPVVHRVELPGQSRFAFPVLKGVQAQVTCASAPDNSFEQLARTIGGAKKELLVRIYQFENDHIADLLVEARRRGVSVTVYAEGTPVGGLPDQERFIAERLRAEGIPVWFIVSDAARHVRNRYRFDHSKYLIVDGQTVMIATENFGNGGHPVDPSYGNRGWMVHVRSPELAAQLRQVWDDDLDPRRHSDLVEVGDDPSDAWGRPYRKPPFNLNRAVIHGDYSLRRAPVTAQGKMNLELVVCPDNCLADDRALLGLIGGARQSLFILQNSIPLWWGSKRAGTVDGTPDLPLQTVVAAARRGVRVRVLLDNTWYNAEGHDPRDNDDTVRYLNELALREKLNIEAKLVNLGATGLEKIHAKGVIADGQRVFVGSINWTENSFKGNREIGVVIDHPEVATYYATLFQRDWALSRVFQAVVGAGGGSIRARPVSGSQVLRQARAGERLDVMAELDGWIEVRLTDKATGYLASSSMEAVLATPEESAALIGRTVRIRGRVRNQHPGSRGISLNFGADWHSDFSIFIPRTAVGAFQAAQLDPATAYEGREVIVSGVLVEKDGPRIEVVSPEAIRIVP